MKQSAVLLVLLTLVSLFITPVEAARNKKRGRAAKPSSTQAIPTRQVDSDDLVAPAPVSSLLKASHQLLAPDIIADELSGTGEGEKEQIIVTPKKAAGPGRKKKEKNKKKEKEPKKSRAEMLNELRKVKVPDSAKTKLGELADTLEKKGIHCKDTFIKMVKAVAGWDQAETSDSLPSPKRKKSSKKARAQVNLKEPAPTKLSTQEFLRKADIFFSHLKPGTEATDIATPGQFSTGGFTAVIHTEKMSVTSFIQYSDTYLKDIAGLETLKTLTSMCARQGFPEDPDSYQAFEALFGEGEGKIPGKYRSRFSSMQSCRGVPDPKQVLIFWEWIRNKQLEDIFDSLSCVLHGKGIPDPNDNKPGSSMQALNDFVGLFGEKGEQIPRKHLSHFTSMQSGKGVPAKGHALGFWQWVQDNTLEDILASLSSLLSRKGIPDPNDEDPGSPMQALNDFIGLFGERDEQIPRKHLSHFTSMQCGKSVPAKEHALGFWQWVQDNKLEDILASLSSVLSGKGIPDPNDEDPGSPMQALNDFVGLFGEREEQIPRQHLPHFTSMQKGKGVPTKECALGFWQWVQGNTLEDILGSLSGVLNGKGVPDLNDNKPGSLMQILNDFVGLFGEREEQIPRQHLPHFTSMQKGKGVPAKERALGFWQWVQGNTLEDILVSLSTALNGRGIPDPNDKKPGSPMQALNDFVGLFKENNEQIPREHLAHFTSMQNGKGVPDPKRALDFWGWVKHKQLEDILRSLSGVLHGKGIPDPDDRREGSQIQALEDFAGLFGEKEGQIPYRYLSRFTWINASRGIPKAQDIKALYAWLSDHSFEPLTTMTKLFQEKGLPNLEKLKKHQSQLQTLTRTPVAEKAPHLALLALYRTAPDPNNLSEQKMTDYLSLLSQQTGRYETGAKILARLLGQHQRAGMEMYRNLIEKNTGWDPHSIITLLLEARHLPLARVAIDDIWQGESDRLADARQFLALARNLKPAPTATQWREFKENFVPVLTSIILSKEQQNNQFPATVIPERALRFYWESLWKVTAMYRVTFQSEENLRALLKGVRSIAGLHGLARRYETKAFEEQCTCLIDFYGQVYEQTADRESLQDYVPDKVRLEQGLAYIQEDEKALCDTDHDRPLALQRSLLRELLPGQAVLMESLLKALESKETFSDNELEDVVTRLDINLPSGEREKWVDQCNERTQSQVSQRVQPLTMEQWADCIGFFEEDDFTDDDYQPEWLLE